MFAETKNGPATYNLNYTLTEAREGRGVTEFREDYHKIDEKVDLRMPLNPKDDLTKPNVIGFKYF